MKKKQIRNRINSPKSNRIRMSHRTKLKGSPMKKYESLNDFIARIAKQVKQPISIDSDRLKRIKEGRGN